MNNHTCAHEKIKEKVDNLSRFLTYPELDDLHVIYDYVCDLEQIIETQTQGG